jgi:hypothetical protein
VATSLKGCDHGFADVQTGVARYMAALSGQGVNRP